MSDASPHRGSMSQLAAEQARSLVMPGSEAESGGSKVHPSDWLYSKVKVSQVEKARIHIGDTISLRVSTGGYMYSEQAFEAGLFVRPQEPEDRSCPLEDFTVCAFKVCVPFESTIQEHLNERREAKQALLDGIAEIDEEQEGGGAVGKRGGQHGRRMTKKYAPNRTKTHQARKKQSLVEAKAKRAAMSEQLTQVSAEIRAAERRQVHEERHNEMEQERQEGNVVVYGDKIQLRQVSSGMFVAAKSDKTCTLDYSLMSVGLQPFSDDMSVFSIMPFYKLQGEGDEVNMDDEVCLFSSAANVCLACTKEGFPSHHNYNYGHVPGDQEMCLSPLRSSLIISRFSKFSDRRDGHLVAGDIVQLVDCANSGTLALSDVLLKDELGQRARTSSLVTSADPRSEHQATALPPFEPLVHLGKNTDPHGRLDGVPKSFWQIQTFGAKTHGGQITWTTHWVVFRHVVSGRYLRIGSNPEEVKRSDPRKKNFLRYPADSTDDPDDVRCAFRLVPSNSSKEGVKDGLLLRIQHVTTGAFLHTSAKDILQQELSSWKEVNKVTHGNLRMVNFRGEARASDVYRVRRLAVEEVNAISYVKSTAAAIRGVASSASEALGGFDEPLQGGTSMPLSAVRHGTKILQDLTQYLHEAGKAGDIEDPYFVQSLLQDCDVLEQIVVLLQEPIASIRDNSKLKQSLDPQLKPLMEAAFYTLTCANHGEVSLTDDHLARHYKCFLRHMLHLETPFASNVVLNIVNGNRGVVDGLMFKQRPESQSGLDSILDALTQANGGTINHHFLNLLSAFCVCNKLSVTRGQETIFNALSSLPGLNPHLFRLSLRGQPASDAPQAKTLDEVLPLWLGFYGTAKVCVFRGTELGALEKQPWVTSKHEGTSGRPSTDERDHMVAQLHLLSDLCEGTMQIPNLMQYVEQIAPYSCVVLMMLDPALPFDVRGGALAVFHEVHLDTPGATPRLAWAEKCRLYQDGNAVQTKVSNDFTNDRQFSADLLVSWAVRPAGQPGLQGSSFRDVLAKYRDQVGTAVSNAMDVTESLSAIMSFVKAVFQSLRFIVSIGVCRRVHMGALLSVVLRDFIVSHDKYVVSNADEERDALTLRAAEVMKEALELVHDLVIEASQHMYGRFLSSFCALFDAMERKSAAAEEKFRMLPQTMRRLRGVTRLMDSRDPASLTSDEIAAVRAAIDQLQEAYNFPKDDEAAMSECLHELCAHPSSSVARSANNTLSLLFNRVQAMFNYCGDHLLLSPPEAGGDSFYSKSVRFGGALYQLVFETQLDDNTAVVLQRQVEQFMAMVLDEQGHPVVDRQNTAFRLHIVHHLLAVFDQELETAPDESLGFERTRNNANGPVGDVLVQVLRCVDTIARSNPEVQAFLFDEMEPLFCNNQSARMGRVAQALALVYTNVFQNIELKLKIQTRHVEAVGDTLRFHDLHGQTPPQLIYLLATMARMRGSVSARSNQGKIIHWLMGYRGSFTGRTFHKYLYETDASGNATRTQLLQHVALGEVTTGDEYAYDLHVAAMELFAVLGNGPIEFVESMCKHMFSVDDLLSGLAILVNSGGSSDQQLMGVAAYLNFLEGTYLSEYCYDVLTKPVQQKLICNPVLWDVFRYCIYMLEEFTRSTSPVLRSVVLEAVAPFVDSFFTFHFDSSSLGIGPSVQGEARSVVGDLVGRMTQAYTAATRLPSATLTNLGIMEKSIITLLAAAKFVYGSGPTYSGLLQTVEQAAPPKRRRQQEEPTQHRKRSSKESSENGIELHFLGRHGTMTMQRPQLTAQERINRSLRSFVSNTSKFYFAEKIEPTDEQRQFRMYGGLALRYEQREAEGELVEYLKSLREDVLCQVHATDDQVAAAREDCATTLNMLRAILLRDSIPLRELYEEFKSDPRSIDAKTGLRDELTERLELKQKLLCEYGAAGEAFKLVAIGDRAVIEAAWALVSELCYDGNVAVQDICLAELQQLKDGKCLQKIRDELSQCVRALLYAAGADLRRRERAQTGDRVAELYENNPELGPAIEALSLRDVPSAHPLQTRMEAELSVEDERAWLELLCSGLKNLVEGGHTGLQLHLLDQGAAININFVAEICRSLDQMCKKVDTVDREWLNNIDHLIDCLQEMCQGNQRVQQDALDEQAVKFINSILMIEADPGDNLSDVLTEVKESSVAILGTMMEQNNEAGKKIARLVWRSLNKDELYEAMNKWYYIHFFYEQVPNLSDELKRESAQSRRAAFKSFHVFAQLEDLTGFTCTLGDGTSSSKDSIHVTREALNAMAGGNNSGNSRIPARFKRHRADPSEEEAVLERWENLDDALASRIKEVIARAGGDVTKAFHEFARDYLRDIEAGGGAYLKHEMADRSEFFQARTASIEFLRDGQLQKVYFEKKKHSLPKLQREEIIASIPRDSLSEKLKDFLSRFESVSRKLEFQDKLRSHPVSSIISEDYTGIWYQAFVVLTLLMNALLLASWNAPFDDLIYRPNLAAWSPIVLLVFAVLHMIMSFILTLEYYVNHANDPRSIAKAANFVYYLLFFGLSLIGPWTYYYFYSLHLLHIIQRNPTLQQSIQSVTKHGRSLLAVTGLGLTLIYIFSLFGFAFFRRDYLPSEGMYCDTLLECFATTLKFGLLAGGGVGDVLQPEVYRDDNIYAWRYVFDIAFFVLVTVIIMNLVLGIIVDTFSELRSDRADIQEDQTSVCFMCGIAAHEFEAVGGFDLHVQRDHNMWNYLYYTMYLQDVQESDQSYHELYLYDMLVQKKQIDPFPMKSSMRLAAQHDDSADRLRTIEQRLKLLETTIVRRHNMIDEEESARFVLAYQEQFTGTQADAGARARSQSVSVS